MTSEITDDEANYKGNHVAGKPKTPRIESRVEVMGGGSFRIGWRTDSYANIEQYRLLYRKTPVSSS